MKWTSNQLLSEAKSAIEELREWIDGGRGAPPEYVSREQLLGCLKTMFEIELNLRAGRLPEKAFRNSGMGRMIVDGWPSDFSLGNKLLEIEQAYRNLNGQSCDA